MATLDHNYRDDVLAYSRTDDITTDTSSVEADYYLADGLFNSAGLYTKSEINSAKFSGYSRFGRMLDPYGRLNDTREYLFFTKPDLHIVIPETRMGSNTSSTNSIFTDDRYPNSGSIDYFSTSVDGVKLKLNPQLDNSRYFADLLQRYPKVVKELQYSAPGNNGDPFCHCLSFTVSSNLDIPSFDASTLDTPMTIFGTSYEYLKDGEASDENPTFSLEFIDSKNLEIFQFFKAYQEYHTLRKSGSVTPPTLDYYRYKRLHNTMGVYKFLVAEDMETLVYWAYMYGVYPTSYPRDAFSEPTFSDGLQFPVSFKAAFVEDMDPRILASFNRLMNIPITKNKLKELPTLYQNYSKTSSFPGSSADNPGYNYNIAITGDDIYGLENNGYSTILNGTIPKAAWVYKMPNTGGSDNMNYKYRFRWFG